MTAIPSSAAASSQGRRQNADLLPRPLRPARHDRPGRTPRRSCPRPSQKYLERILRTLAEAGLIEGSHGKGGGYRLLRSPADYTAGEILRAAEGTLACLGEDVQLAPAETASGVSEVYRRLDAQIRAALDAVTLSSLTAADAGDEYVI